MMKHEGGAAYSTKAAVFLCLMFSAAYGIGGGFFSKSAFGPLKQDSVFGGQQFQFVITATNFPQLSSVAGEPGLLSFAIAPVRVENLLSQGFLYSGYTSITSAGGGDAGYRIPRIIRRSNFLFGHNIAIYGVSSDETAVMNQIMRASTMPLWGLTHFLSNPNTFNNLIHNGFYQPCMVMEPVLLGDKAFGSDFLGVTAGAAARGVIRHHYFFGNDPEVVDQYSASIQPASPVSAIAPLPMERNQQQVGVSVQSNIRSLTASLPPDKFFFMIGLTRTGQWGFLVVVLGKYYLEAVRKELFSAMTQGKDDFDSAPPGGGASGAASTTAR